MTDREWNGGVFGIALVLACASLLLMGCSGDDGVNGLPGADSAILSGQVTCAGDGVGLGGATLSLSPSVPGVTITVDASGHYNQELPVGKYTLSASAGADFVAMAKDVSILAGVDTTLDFPLAPTTPVKVVIADPGVRNPGDAVGLSATVTIFDGSGPVTYVWTQSNSVPVAISGGTTATPTVTLPNAGVYKDYLLEHLHMGDLDRWQVLPIDPHAAEDAANVEIECDVTTSSGTYSATVEVTADLPFSAWTTGVDTVPVGVPVLLGGRDQESYAWSLTRPTGSATVLVDATTRNPYFTPDVAGAYVLTVHDDQEGADYSWTVYAGTYTGMIVGQEPGAPGQPTIPVADSMCRACHSGIVNSWRNTGHAHIFSTQIDTSTHYSTSCFSCHTVGFGTGAGGIDDQPDYAEFLAKNYFHHTPGDNWTEVLADEPATARLANIQCENCHGPQDSLAHELPHKADSSRISLSAGVCGSCHGEPPRHGRYQQWEESGHANYELAVSEGWDDGVRSCSICHTANGFLYWGENGGWDTNDSSVPSNLVSDAGKLHPITCVVCHDPHAVGTVSGEANDAPLRIEGDTPPLGGGFEVMKVGKGAICMVCHNGRRGLRNDETWKDTTDRDRATHLGPQSDVLVSQNAYFVETGWREPHSLIADTCVTCHLELTPPPEDLSYQLGGTNHSFAAKPTICKQCHGDFTADNLVNLVDTALEGLDEYIPYLLAQEIDYQVGLQGNWVQLDGYSADGEGQPSLSVTITETGSIDSIELVESHGRQAMHVHLSGGTTVYNVRLASDTSVFPAGGAPGSTSLLDSYGGQLLARAGWNMYLLHADGSHGIHNPGFVQAILQATFAKLDELQLYYQNEWLPK